MNTSLLNHFNLSNFFIAGVLSLTTVPSFANPIALGNIKRIPPREGPLIIEEFVDFQCSYCAKGNETMQELQDHFKDKILVVVRNAPLEVHGNALVAAKAHIAVKLQYAEVAPLWRNQIFAHQKRLETEGENFIFETAGLLGINIKQMKEDMESPRVAKLLEQDQQRFAELGFKGTPSFVIGSQKIEGSRSFEEFKSIIDSQISMPIEHL